MNIQMLKLSDIKPYENNPRKNNEAVKYVAQSIKEFGFKVPIVIDKDNVIIAGHTRYKAAKRLKIKEVPTIIVDDLTDEQVKAFRLADNKVAEKAEWDFDLLPFELDDIVDIDMGAFDFDNNKNSFNAEIDIIDNDDDTADIDKDFHRDMTYRAYNLELVDLDRTSGKYQMPTLSKTTYIPDELIGFNYMKTSENKNVGIHCFVDDYQFERLWNNPYKYIDDIMDYNCILTPDFSLYMDMPMPMKIWNVFRSRLLGQFWQDLDIEIIPTVSWAEPETFEFCFDGIAENSVVAISTIGVKKDKNFKIWVDGMNAMIERIKPSTILVYGGKVDFDYKGIDVRYYDNQVTERMQATQKTHL